MVNEAVASGLPVLGSVYSQAAVELVEDAVSGWTSGPILPRGLQGADRVLPTPLQALHEMRENLKRAVMS